MSAKSVWEKSKIAFESLSTDEQHAIAAYEPDIYSDIDERNNWSDDTADPAVRRLALQMGSELVRELLGYIMHKIDASNARSQKRAFIRFLSAVWVLRPELCVDADGKSLSLIDMATPLGITKCWLSMVAEKFSDDFGYLSRNQKSRKSRVNYAKGATKGWEKRRAKSESESKKD